MLEIVRLEHRIADPRAVHLAELPDIFPGHRGPRLPRAALAPGRPEQRCPRRERALHRGERLSCVMP